MQGIHRIPRIRQILGRVQGFKDVPLQQEVRVEAGVLEPVHGGDELASAICSEAVACDLSERTFAFNEAPCLVALEGVVPCLQGDLFLAEFESS